MRKSDTCDLCKEYGISRKKNKATKELKVKYEEHVKGGKQDEL